MAGLELGAWSFSGACDLELAVSDLHPIESSEEPVLRVWPSPDDLASRSGRIKPRSLVAEIVIAPSESGPDRLESFHHRDC
jgi:hypothetical protein